VSTALKYHDSLKEQFPSLTNLQFHNIKKWLLLPAATSDFEEVAVELCELKNSI